MPVSQSQRVNRRMGEAQPEAEEGEGITEPLPG